MNSRSPFAAEIDRVADLFEAAWRASGRPDPGDYLSSVQEVARRDLLIALVRVDVEYRQKAGEAITEQQGLREFRDRYGTLPGLSAAQHNPADATTRESAQPPATRSTRIDQYQLVRELGVGGMGVVWLAHDTQLERDVALKILKPGLIDRSSQRLLREARSAARLSHPNVVSVYHILEWDGQICIVMELLGRSLSDELRDNGRLPWLDATRAIRDAADGLAAAHAADLVHRDIKPSNLLRTARGVMKVADFGLVDSPDATQLTATGAVLGTPGYMAPEQCRGEHADARSDVYALGCTYYHLLTGHPPFEADDSHAVMAKHANDPFPDPRRTVPELPDTVCHIIETACRKDAKLRYETAGQMLVELQAILAPVVAEPPPPATPPGGRLRIFISSPGDVAEERVVANKLVRRLSDEYADRIWIEPVFWEHEPLLAHDTFQSQIPRPSESEIVVCILWSRLGTRLPAEITRPDGTPYASGTEYEFEDAVEGRKKNGYPDLLVYRKTAKPMVDIENKTAVLRRLDQKELLDAFVQKWFFHGGDGTLKAAFHTFDNTAAFEDVLEQHLRKLIGRRAPAEGSRGAAPAKPSWTCGSPFRGLDVFEFEHAPVFFGRTQAVGDVLNALRTNAAAGRAFVLVVGVSGGGKSSLVRAGVLPVLTQPGVIEGVALWRRAVLKPSDASTPLRALAAALLQPEALPELGYDGTTAGQLAELLQKNPDGAFLLIKGGISQAAATLAREQSLSQQPEARLVIVADQLEELFTLGAAAAAECHGFVAALSSLARSGRVFVIATLRGDFYHCCFDLPELVALQEGSGQYALPLSSSTEIGQVIRQPARAAGLSFEEDPITKVPLDEVLREAAASSPESLPLLEFALEELYQRKTAVGLLTYAAYRDLGGVEGALAQRAESVFALLVPEVQATLPRVMRALVNVTAANAVARQKGAMQLVAPTPASKALVDAFVQARLFSADRTEQGQAVVQVAHEALLRNWPRVVQSLEHDKELLIVRARVSAAAARWMADGKPSDLLLGQGKPLAEAENLAAQFGDELAPADRALIDASKTRRTRRRAVLVFSLAAVIAFGVVIRAKVIQQQRATQADGLVKRLIAADTAQVPDALKEITSYRRWADPLLREANERAAPDSRQRLHTSLGLLPVDAAQADFLYGRLLLAEPDELPVIRDALYSHRQALLDRLWAVVEKPEKGKESTRLRAAAALAKYDPDGKKWTTTDGLVANDLVRENPMFLGLWSEAFRPVRLHLLPALASIFRDPSPDRSAERNLATNLLADYAADQPDVLADLLMDADEKQFAAIYPKLKNQSERGLPVFIGEIDEKLPADARDDVKEKLAKRQANAAVVLLRMNQPEKVWPLLRHSSDPRRRSYLIHRLGPLGADPRAIIKQMDDEPDLSIRRALILSLGEFGEQDISPEERTLLTTKLLAVYETGADPGLHAAAEWLLRQWGQEAALKAINEKLRMTDTRLLTQLKSQLPADQQRQLDDLLAKVERIQTQLAEEEKQLPARQAVWERNLLQEPAQTAPAIDEGLIAYYPLSKSGDTGLDSGLENQAGGVYEGTGKPQWVAGVVGQSLVLDGNGSIAAGKPVNLEGDQPFSYGCWVQCDGAPAMVLLSTRDQRKGFRGFDLSLEPGYQLRVQITGEDPAMPDADRKAYSPNSITVIATTHVDPTKRPGWYHVMATYDGSKKATGVRIFVDGKPQPTRILDDRFSGTMKGEAPLFIGSRQGLYRFRGKLQDVRVYNQELHDVDVEQLYASMLEPILRLAPASRTPEQQRTVSDCFRRNDEALERLSEQLGEQLAIERESLQKLLPKWVPGRWFVNTQGQTMVVIPGPVEFVMGSPLSEANRREDQPRHKVRIIRTFPLAATPVTKEQFLRFRPNFEHSEMRRYPEPACPIGGVVWYEAAAYCNWLSKQEGITEDQWCYEVEGGDITKLKEGYLGLTGYRLPTEAETEYATRAGAITSRYYGEAEDLLSKYAWYYKNSQQKTWPVGSKKPNDLGFFDVHGNIACWCQESYKRYPDVKDGAVDDDKEDELTIVATTSRVLRGGSFAYLASDVRCAYRNYTLPTSRNFLSGLRPARTLPLVPLTPFPPPREAGPISK